MLSKLWDPGAKSFFLLFRGKGKEFFKQGRGDTLFWHLRFCEGFERMANVCGLSRFIQRSLLYTTQFCLSCFALLRHYLAPL